jgi:hypothetical protein
MMLLTSCQKPINNTLPSINLPEFPVIPIESNKELKTAFNPVCTKTYRLISTIKDNIAEYKQNEIENKNKINEAENLISELNILCSPKSGKTKEWMDDLYKFKVRYYIYKEGLK